jgi:hypothetical protein
MSLQVRAEAAQEGLSTSILRVVDDPERIEPLRQILSTFTHRCRNSLNGIKMSLYLFKREGVGSVPAGLSELERTYQNLELLFDRLQVIYRPFTLTLVRAPLGQLVSERLPSWRSWLNVKGRTLEVSAPAIDLAGDFDPMYMALGLDAFVAWRADAAHTDRPARLSCGIADGFFEVRWEEGPSTQCFPPEDRKFRHQKGSRPDGQVDSLALPLLARIVAAHGGYMETGSDPALVMSLRWPRFQTPQQGT